MSHGREPNYKLFTGVYDKNEHGHTKFEDLRDTENFSEAVLSVKF